MRVCLSKVIVCMKISYYLLGVMSFSLPVLAISPGDLSRLVLRSPSPAAGSYTSLSSKGREIVAATSKGEIVSSSDDGASWTPRAIISYEQGGLDRKVNFNGAAASPSEWVLVSQDGRYARSTNLLNWESGQGGGPASELIYAEGLFVSVSFTGRIETSPHGEVWTRVTVPAEVTRLEGVTYGEGRFVAAGKDSIIYSDDGLTWTAAEVEVTLPEWLESTSWVDGTFYAVGRRGLFFTSPDGASWTRRDLGTTQGFGGDVIAYPAGEISIHTNNHLFTLNDNLTGVTEMPLVSGFSEILLTDEGSFVGVGSFARLYRAGPNEPEMVNKNESLSEGFDSVAFGNDAFVMIDPTLGRVFRSLDGTNWSLVEEQDGGGFSSDVFFDGSQFVVFDNEERIWRSENGESWTQTATNLENFRVMRRVNEEWVAGHNSGSVSQSRDGVSWTMFEVPGASGINDVAFGEGVYVVTAFAQSLYTSSDLQNWTARSVNNSTANSYWNVEYGDGRFMAFGSFDSPALSEDGITWNELTAQGKLVGSAATGFDSELGFYVLLNERAVYWPPGSSIDDRFIDGARYGTSIRPSAMASGNSATVLVGSGGLLMSSPLSSDAYELWVLENFGPGTTDSTSGIGRDPEGDGVSNLEEYARGTDPLAATSPIPLTLVQTAFGPEISYEQRSGLNDIQAGGEWSYGLSSWSNFSISREVVALADGKERVTVRAVGFEDEKEFYLRASWRFLE